MNKIGAALAVMLIVAACSGGKKNEGNDLAEANLRGEVSMVKITAYGYDERKGVWEEIRGDYEETHYSPSGMVVRNSDGLLTDVYSYDGEGRLEKIETINHYRGDLITSVERYSYGVEGRLEKIDYELWGTEDGQRLFSYDAEGRKTSERYEDYDEGAVSKAVYNFYDGGSPSEDVWSECENVTVNYYEAGVLTRQDIRDKGARYTVDYEYDNGRVERKVCTSGNGSKSVSEYNRHGDIEVSRAASVLNYGRMVHNNFTYEYKYDKEGNWTECEKSSERYFCDYGVAEDGTIVPCEADTESGDVSVERERIREVREITYYEGE